MLQFLAWFLNNFDEKLSGEGEKRRPIEKVEEGERKF